MKLRKIDLYVTDSESRFGLTILAFTGILGFLIGSYAWGDGRTPAIAVTVPVFIAVMRTRLRAFVLAMGYLAAVVRGTPEVFAAWSGNFDRGVILAVAICLIGAGVMGAMGWSSSQSPWRKAAAVAVAWVVALLPPIAFMVPAHPLVAWGYVAENWKWFGVLASVMVPCVFVWILLKNSAKLNPIPVLLLVLFTIAVMTNKHQPIEHRYAGEYVAVSTKWGKLRTAYDSLNRIERIGNTVRKFGEEKLAKVLVYPESILGVYDQSFQQVLNQEIIKSAAQTGQVVVLGMDFELEGGGLQTMAVGFYPDGSIKKVSSRMPLPFILWHPWDAKDTFTSNVLGDNILPLSKGVKARIIFCAEEYAPFLSLINEARDDHQLVVVMANTWADKSGRTSAIQMRHSEGMALLFGRKLIRAENRAGELKLLAPVPGAPR